MTHESTNSSCTRAEVPVAPIGVMRRPASEQTEVHWSCLLPVSSDRESAKANLVQAAVRARLFDALRERTQVAYGVSGALNITAGGHALLRWSTQVANHQLVAALESLFTTILDRSPTRWESGLQFAKRDIAFGTVLSLTTTAALADRLARYWVFGWEPSKAAHYPELVSQMTTSQFMGQLETCFSRLKIGIVGDESTAVTAVAQAREGLSTSQ